MVKISKFFHLFRKKGLNVTFELLSNEENYEMPQSEFLRELKKRKNDLNAYFRVRKDLLKHHLISFKMNKRAQKVIYLTETGKFVLSRINEIESKLSEYN